MNNYYLGGPFNIYTIINKYYSGKKLGDYHQKRVRVNYHYFVVMDNSLFPSMVVR